MSLHRPLPALGADAKFARCACGWQSGAPFSLTFERDAAYDTHVREVLGVEAYYTAGAGCTNCGHEQVASALVGRPISSAHCERCGTGSLVPTARIA